MSVVRDMLAGITRGMEWLGSQVGPAGVLAALALFAYALAWGLLR